MKRVEIIYSEGKKYFFADILLKEGAKTVHDAILQSGVLEKFNIDLEQQPVGIFGRKVSLTHIIEHYDRIEIYTPLQLDPKEKRRKLVSEAKKETSN